MKAQNLTISVPAERCDKNCPYCISMITWQPDNDIIRMYENLSAVQRVADRAGVTNVLITSKREPFMNSGETLHFARCFMDYWLEIQTNGLYLSKHVSSDNEAFAIELSRCRVNVIAFSIDQLEDIDNYADVFKTLKKFGIITRVCINLTKKITSKYGFYNITEAVTKHRDERGIPYVRQLLFRDINYPSTASKDSRVVQWIDENVNSAHYTSIVAQAVRAEATGDMRELRKIPHTGVTIYSYKNLSICFSDYCIQEKNRTEDIRSLIFQSDGHLYTSWDDPASILF